MDHEQRKLQPLHFEGYSDDTFGEQNRTGIDHDNQVDATGRTRERADVLDFIRHPPGRVPEHMRAFLADLAAALERGDHVGCAARLYEGEG